MKPYFSSKEDLYRIIAIEGKLLLYLVFRVILYATKEVMHIGIYEGYYVWK